MVAVLLVGCCMVLLGLYFVAVYKANAGKTLNETQTEVLELSIRYTL